MVMVSVSETYDLSTIKDKMSLIGIHTPTKELIQKTYPGLCMNSKYFRIVKTDVVLSAVAGTVAITPDMVGDNAQDGIAPEDVLNPILYKAVSNESWSTLEARLFGLDLQSHEGNPTPQPLAGSQAFVAGDNVTGLNDEFGVYYSLLSNRDGFKLAPIQQGMEMRSLKPLVFEKYFTSGHNQFQENPDALDTIYEDKDNGLINKAWTPAAFRGRAHSMPRINTTYLTGNGNNDVAGSNRGTKWEYSGMGDGTPVNYQIEVPDVPPVMLACIVMPPCRKTKLFFRMRVRTWIEFTEVRPIQEITSFAQMNLTYAPLVYHSDYHELSTRMDHVTDMVDTKNASIEKIMEGR